MSTPIKKFGQNFLKSESVVSTIIDTASVSKDTTVIEVGPGYGALTFELAQRVKKVYAIEKDRNLASFLRETISERGITNIEIIEADIRDVSVSKIIPEQTSYTLIGNIPYYITGLLFRKFLEEELQKPNSIIFMVQKEVAERIVSREPRHSLLSVSVWAYGTPAIVTSVPRSLFSPPPNVDSAVIKVSTISRERFLKTGISEKLFFALVRAGFSHPRKLLVSNLAEGLDLPKEKIRDAFHTLGLNEKARAGELSVEQWFRIAKHIGVKSEKTQNNSLKLKPFYFTLLLCILRFTFYFFITHSSHATPPPMSSCLPPL